MKKRWYVVADRCGTDLQPGPEEAVWTVSRYPDDVGWINDSNTQGYGLTWDEATELADAANAAWEAKKVKS